MARRFDPEDLARWLDSVALLDGRLVFAREGPLLIWPRAAIDPRLLLAAGELPAREALVRAIDMRRPPLEVSARLLARIQRDIKRLRHRDARAAITEARRRFRRHGVIDEARLDERQAELDALSARWRDAPSPGQVMVALAGDAGARQIERLMAEIRRWPRRRLRLGRLRLAEIVHEADGPGWLSIRQLSGRARLRRLRRRVASELGIATADLGTAEPHELALPPAGWRYDAPFREQVRAVGEQLLDAEQRRLRAHGRAEGAARVAACYGLLFALDDKAARMLAEPDVLALAERRLGAVVDELTGIALSCSEVLALLRIPKLGAGQLRVAGGWIAEGLGVDELAFIARADSFYELASLSAVERRLYARWMVTLVPHYARHGIEVALAPTELAELVRAYGSKHAEHDMALVAHCLIKHHQRKERAAENLLSLLDDTLALFRGLPESLRELVRRIDRVDAGLGRRTHPGYAEWLGDDERLDRYLTLLELVDGHARLSNRARRDFDKSYLPVKTRRWLAGRIDELVARAYDRELDALLARLVEQRFGAPALGVDQAWRNALRVHLLSGPNQDHLATLVALVARGGVLRELPENAAWIERKRGSFDVDGWLRPFDEELCIAGVSYRLHTEERPLEVLPMGIPFGTCLALGDGMNAASAIMNAIDIDKRVIYLRRASTGAIVARKLIAVSTADTLVGFRIYSALPGEQRLDVESAVDGLAARIAGEARLALASSGTVAALHEGFWYDDGAVPFTARPGVTTPAEDLATYAAWLGRSGPAIATPEMGREAWSFAACERGEAPRGDVGRGLLARHLMSRLRDVAGLERMRAAVLHDDGLRHGAFLVARDELGPVDVLRWAEPLADDWAIGHDLFDLLRHQPPSAALAETLLGVAGASARRSARLDDHGFAHGTFYFAPRHFAALRTAAFFDCVERLATLWDRVVADNPSCADCRATGERGLFEAASRVYRAHRDPAAVLTVLRAKRRHHLLTRRLALRIAAAHRLDGALEDTPAEVPGVRRALRALATREPGLAGEPELLAAWLRHCRPDASPGLASLPAVSRCPLGVLAELTRVFPERAAEIAAPFLRERPTTFWARDHHRRHLTPYRIELRRELASGERKRIGELSLLGDVEAIDGDRGRRHNQHLLLARAVRDQLDRPDARAALSVYRAAAEAGVDPEACLDPRGLAGAWRVLDEDEEALDAEGFAAMLATVTPVAQLGERLERRWRAGDPNGAWRTVTRRALERGSYGQLPSIELLIRASRHPGLHTAIAGAVGRCASDEACRLVIEAATAAEVDPGPLLAAWTIETLHQHDLLALEHSEHTLALVAPILVVDYPPERWLPGYLRLSDALGASRFLDAIAGSEMIVARVLDCLDRVQQPREPHATWLREQLLERSS